MSPNQSSRQRKSRAKNVRRAHVTGLRVSPPNGKRENRAYRYACRQSGYRSL